ncbi:prevent-host-death protein [Calothrix sp. NIES-4071]|nr:prevent-host-death protein [Calothrix sp. NIES-4071]BAZ60120.1 prevent-host-death protein [Calothrix sp. NIES-4105]
MQSYPLKKVPESYEKVLEDAAIEPVMLTSESQQSFVIMSVTNYEQLVKRVVELEDCVFGQLAQANLNNSQMLGSEVFTAELQRLASFDTNDKSHGET